MKVYVAEMGYKEDLQLAMYQVFSTLEEAQHQIKEWQENYSNYDMFFVNTVELQPLTTDSIRSY